MLIKCHFSKGKIAKVQFLWPNEDSVRKMTICHPPQHEEKDPMTSHLPLDLNLVAQCFKEFFFLIFFILFSACKPPYTTIFIKPKNPNLIHHFGLHCKSFVRRKPIPEFDPRTAILQ